MSALPTVLIVDDEVRSLESLKRILADDFDVKIAGNLILEGWTRELIPGQPCCNHVPIPEEATGCAG